MLMQVCRVMISMWKLQAVASKAKKVTQGIAVLACMQGQKIESAAVYMSWDSR